MLKKIIALATSVTLLVSMNVPNVDAASVKYDLTTEDGIHAYLDSCENVQEVTMSENEYLSQMDELNSITKEQRKDYNSRLKELSKYSKKKLKSIGYTSKQIKDIQSYDGKQDAINYVNARGLSNATLTFRYGLAGSNNTKQKIMIAYDIRWNRQPTFSGTDTIALAWRCDDSNSKPISMTYAVNPVTLSYTLYDVSSDVSLKTYSKKLGTSHTNYVSTSLSMSDGNRYVKTIGGTVTLKTASGSKNIKTVTIAACYAKSTRIGVTPSLSISTSGASISISPNGGGQKSIVDHSSTFNYNSQKITTVTSGGH